MIILSADFLQVGQWMLEVFQKLWTAFGAWGIFGFALIFFPVLHKLVRLFRSLIHTLF